MDEVTIPVAALNLMAQTIKACALGIEAAPDAARRSLYLDMLKELAAELKSYGKPL